MRSNKPVRFGLEGLPLDQEQAVKWLLALVRAAESKTLPPSLRGESLCDLVHDGPRIRARSPTRTARQGKAKSL